MQNCRGSSVSGFCTKNRKSTARSQPWKLCSPFTFQTCSVSKQLKAVVGQAPKDATDLGGNRWRLVYDKKREMEGLLGIDGMKLEGKEKDPPIKVQQAETVLKVEEMMDLIEDKLALKAKKALFLGK